MTGAGVHPMTLEIDHVIVVVADLAAAARRFCDDFGLASVAGGRHRGHGTANRIVPLGDTYVELMGVVDEAEAGGSPLGRFVRQRAEGGDRLAALCLRTASLDDLCMRLDLDAVAMTRDRPDGVQLAWRIAGLDRALGPDALPFFIEWEIELSDHPGRMAAPHSVTPHGIAWVEMGGPEETLAAWLGDHDLDIKVTGLRPGIRRVGLRVGGDIVEL